MSKKPLPPTGEIILYPTEDGRSRVACRFSGETVWLTQALLAELYQKDVRTINEHLQNLFEEGELDPEATIRKFRTVRREGEREVARLIEHYNLAAILAVGYRVRSPRGVQFRRWATERLSEYLVKGFTMDDERLMHPPVEGSGVPDYFDELLERIRDIRASEKRMYLRVKEIFAMAADYQPSAPECVRFFQVMQNKLHFAAAGKTAAELIAARADHANEAPFRTRPRLPTHGDRGGVRPVPGAGLVETQSSLFAADLRRVEDAKIQCGKAHFEALQVREAPAQYVVVRTFDDLMARVDS